MLPPMKTGWPIAAKAAGRSGWPGPKARVAPFAMDEEPAALALDLVPFLLAGVVRDVEEQIEARLRKIMTEHAPGQMRDDLTVGERAVDARAHGAEIALPELGRDRRAGEFEIGQADALRRRLDDHLAQKLGADLVPETARAAMDAHDHIAALQSEDCGDGIVEDLRHLLHFEVMVARSERAHLGALARLGVLGDGLGLRARHRAALLDALEVAGDAIAFRQRPARAADQHCVHLAGIERDLAAAPEARGDVGKEAVGEFALQRLDVAAPAIPSASVRTPQEMSKPTPPAETTPPSSGSKAATPPIGKP